MDFNIDRLPCPCGSGKRLKICCGRDNKVFNAIKNINQIFYYYFNSDSLTFAENYPWESHCDAVKQLVNKSLTQCNKNSVAVLGAGNCKDIPLELLTENFDSIHLYDLDWFTLKQTTKSLPEPIKQKISLFSLDLTGLWTRDMPDIINNIENGNFLACKHKIRNLSKKPTNMPRFKYKYDLVLSINVVSQLFSPLLQLFIQESEIPIAPDHVLILECAIKDYHNAVIVKQHLDLVKSITAPNGRVIISTDKYEWGNGLFAKNNNMSVNNINELFNLETQKLLQQVTGSTINQYIGEYFSDITSKQWLWHFKKDRVYLVEGFLAKSL